ncbi:MAG: hypothetical protein GMKNLPBB_01500 [Myxococcota bacterium]|nr:hypothetical protein [Myxococcota bacterium]
MKTFLITITALALAAPSVQAEDYSGQTWSWSGYVRVEPQLRALREGAAPRDYQTGAGIFEAETAAAWNPFPAFRLAVDVAGILRGGNHRELEPGDYRLLLYEGYVDLRPFSGAAITIGKRRAPWGTGFTLRPSDLINPPLNAFDPALQREGAYSLGAGYAWSFGGVELVAAPGVSDGPEGWPAKADFSLKATTLAARLALTIAGADFSLLYYLQQERHRFAATAVRYVLDDMELHGEILVRDNRPLAIPVPAAARMLGLDVSGWSVQALAGPRYSNPDNGLEITVEYLVDTAGLDGDEFNRALALIQLARAQGQSVQPGGGAQFAVNSQTLRRHYLTALVRRAKFESDWIPALGVRTGLEDGGAVLFPSLEHRLHDSATIAAGAFVFLAPDRAEFSQAPFDAVGWVRATVFF